ncbi:Cys/Met metabolism PLP-dependent enzyme-domain-containing protein [Gautieria morchelliformis]|nr:Cys/Met metabolism PLP-dependent enzyme-domain-containing protein [Gautieria morchelliformis]
MSKVAAQLQGLEVTFMDFDMTSDDDVVAAVRENTKLVWIETPTSPTLCLTFPILQPSYTMPSRPLILVDSTFLSPFCISPLAGPTHADIILHSLTKYIKWHSDVLMGAVIFPKAQSSDSDALYQKLLFIQNAMGGAKTLAL